MAHHGYEVKNGYFNGICGGHKFAPIEVERKVADSVVASVRLDVENQLILAAELKEGKRFPREAKSGKLVKGDRGMMIDEVVPFNEAPAHHQEDAVDSAVYKHESRARHGKGFADGFEALIARVHGQPLQVVQMGDKPASILPGEERIDAMKRVLIVRYVDGARVQWKFLKADGKAYQGWTGVQAWRKLPLKGA